MPRYLKFTDAIHEATELLLDNIPEVYVMGLGVDYKNGADGTMGELAVKYPTRVLDTPISEATTTGAAIGSAISGMRPIIHHGRVEFALFAADQIFTQAAKWNYMFGGGNPVPVVFRIAIGRQWGNGPQHTQTLYGLFGGSPGLKVVIPSSPRMAKGLLIAAVKDNNPVVFLEPRWLYQLTGPVEESEFSLSLDSCRIVRIGKDVTVATFGDGVMAAMQVAEELETFGVSLEVIDLVSINPIDHQTIRDSVSKTGRLITFESASAAFSVGTQVVSDISINCFDNLLRPPVSIAAPNVPVPTATSLTAEYYPNRVTLRNEIGKMFNLPKSNVVLTFEDLHHAPKTEVMF